MRAIMLLLLPLCACAGVPKGCERGEISYYAASLSGRQTASGEKYQHDAMTAAHRTLPFGTDVQVTLGNKRVHVRINDRGPFARGRILDVSGAAAKKLDLTKKGHADALVCVE